MASMTKSRAACLIGWPAAHSRSPLIHHYWLRTLGIEGGYVIEAVPPDEFQDFVFRLSLRGFVGANVTRPHKEQALALSKPDDRARAVGAANTLWFEDGELKVHLGVEKNFAPARKAHPAFLVEDLAALTAALTRAGCPISHDEPLEGYDRIFAHDPFGNRIELLEVKAPSPGA